MNPSRIFILRPVATTLLMVAIKNGRRQHELAGEEVFG